VVRALECHLKKGIWGHVLLFDEALAELFELENDQIEALLMAPVNIDLSRYQRVKLVRRSKE
jgi:hypothetical protein